MSFTSFIETQRWARDAKALALDHREKWPYAGVLLVCLAIYAFSHSRDEVVHVYKSERTPDFKDARILGSQGDSIYEGKERLLNKTMRELLTAQAELRESNAKLQAKLDAMEKGGSTAGTASTPSAAYGPNPTPSLSEPGAQLPQTADQGSGTPIRLGPAPEHLPITQGQGGIPTSTSEASHMKNYAGPAPDGSSSRLPKGKTIISFPVKDIVVEKKEGITLPAGSYVKAKLMTGVEAPEGKTYPVLLQLDYAYVVPNHKKVDLSGCFMIAKSQGDLSTERVQMQATKLSCVSKEGRMFEREVNGFITDDKDNSFAVMGSVNSKQDRVAGMAFLSSIVEGVGKAIQQAQTTQQTNALGGNQSIMTGNQAAYLGGGGAANAAGMVTQWYLKQAQNLLPTINIGSGQDVWVVMQDSIGLPNDYFRKNMKGGENESVYTYFSRLVD